MQDGRIKLRTQRVIVAISVALFLGKIAAYFLTNSVGILTDALESTVNVITGFISLYSISVALKPNDKEHPFGHGKIESLSASIEGFLILLAGLVIIAEAIKRFFSPAEVHELDTGIIIIAAAGAANYLAGMYSIRVGKSHNSIALVAGGKHLQSDTYSTIGLVIGLILVRVTGMMWLDSVLAMVFGTIIIYTGAKILKETSSNLMDEADFDLLRRIADVLWKNKTDQWIDIHNLKVVKYGDTYHIDCDLTLPWYINIAEAHEIGNNVVRAVEDSFEENIDFTIHSDSCDNIPCPVCSISDCPHRKKAFQSTPVWTTELITGKSLKKGFIKQGETYTAANQ
jgi:cation diffusion facilitator family transporter